MEELKKLKKPGLREISLGVESGDDWTLECIHKGYHAEDILEEMRWQKAVLVSSLGGYEQGSSIWTVKSE